MNDQKPAGFSCVLRCAALSTALASLSELAHAQNWFDVPRLLDLAPGELRAHGDFDGDGDIDLLAVEGAAPGWSGFRLYWNDGQAHFSAGSLLALDQSWVPPDRSGPFYADVTHDGIADLVTNAVGGLAWFPGLGGGNFGALTIAPTAWSPAAIALADLDGDGNAEVAEMHENLATVKDEVRWFAWNGTTLAPSAPLALPSFAFGGPALRAMLATDVDGDSVPDLLIAGGSAQLRYLPTVGGAAQAPIDLPFDGSGAGALLGGDHDGDGDTDILVLNVETGICKTHFWLLRQGPAQYAQGPIQSAYASTGAIQVKTDFKRCWLADWDHDGRDDLLLHTQWGNFNDTGAILGLRSDGLGSFDAYPDSLYVTLSDAGGGAGAADFDGDGSLDFASARALLYGDGSFFTRFQKWVDFGSYGYPILDVEGDGDIDLLSIQKIAFPYTVVGSNDATGSFLSGYGNGPAGWARCLGDFNGDGLLDSVTARYQLMPFQLVFLGMQLETESGTSGFHALGPATAGAEISVDDNLVCHPADLDLDGDLDIAGSGGFWSNDGSGMFALQPAYLGTAMDLGDADVDGDVDVLEHRSIGKSASFSFLANDGAGAFAASLLVAGVAEEAYLPARGNFLDLDGDGDLDVAVGTATNAPAGSTHWLLERGSGGYSLWPALVDPAGGGGVYAAWDADGDGLRDLVAGVPGGYFNSSGTSSIRVFRRIAGQPHYGAPARFWSLGVSAFADFDQDGDIDVLNGGRALLNRKVSGGQAGLIRQYGFGAAGTGGFAPVVGESGPPIAGSTTHAIHVVNGRGGAPSLLVLAPAEGNLPVPGLPNLISWISGPPIFLPFVMSGPPGAPGLGELHVPIHPDASFAGLSFFKQVVSFDPASPTLLTASNGLQVSYP